MTSWNIGSRKLAESLRYSWRRPRNRSPEFSEKLNEHGILSYRVLYFEQDSKSQFIPPDEYRPFEAGGLAMT